ncbi:MAG: DnaD domain protein, partial [Clostridia bacterium]|nr:DnaD domain protein [Clostridia bacterium]
MSLFFQPTAFSSAFTVSCAVADEHLKLASFTQIKVILYLFRHMSALPEKDDVAKALSIPVSEVEDAVRYWIRAGILGDDSVVLSEQNEKSAKQTVVQNMRPTREDVARRGNEDEQLRFLFQEAQMRFGRTLKASEASTLLWLYDDEGMPLSVILLLLQYAVREDRCNISFIEKTAVS